MTESMMRLLSKTMNNISVKANSTAELQRLVHLKLVEGWVPIDHVSSEPFFKYVQVMKRK